MGKTEQKPHKKYFFLEKRTKIREIFVFVRFSRIFVRFSTFFCSFFTDFYFFLLIFVRFSHLPFFYCLDFADILFGFPGF
jgi:hypothetical protein